LSRAYPFAASVIGENRTVYFSTSAVFHYHSAKN
jgi:hypothetical protein